MNTRTYTFYYELSDGRCGHVEQEALSAAGALLRARDALREIASTCKPSATRMPYTITNVKARP